MRTVACLLLSGVTVVAAGARVDRVPVPPPRPYGFDGLGGSPLPGTSCAAAACHGRGHAGGPRSEYLTWAPDLRPGTPGDPHARAYQVLLNPASKRIADALGLPAPAHETALCLKCHAVEAVRPAGAVVEGVGCCACHGPAERWLSAHYQPGWRALSNREKCEDYGFVPARNLTARALNCAGCHVGDATREVNHELIAAGHPRLTFEFAGLHATAGYRKHWAEALPPAEFEPRAWVVGQAVSLRAATALLRDRAVKESVAEADADWPEFAGYSCTSCHRAIRATTPRPVPRAQRARGKTGWEVLSVAAAEVAAEFTPQVFPGAPAPRLAAVRDLRALMARGSPNPGVVRQRCAAALAELDAWVATIQAAEDRPGGAWVAREVSLRLLNALAADALSADRAGLKDHDPDFLAAHAAGCRAVLRGVPDARLSPPVAELVGSLPVPHTLNGRLTDWGAGLAGARLPGVRDRFLVLFELTRPAGEK